MFLLRRSDAPLFIECCRILIGRLEWLDGRNGDHNHFHPGLPLKVLTNGPDALFPIPIDRPRMIAYIAWRTGQLDLGPFIQLRLGYPREENEIEGHRYAGNVRHRCPDCSSCSTA